MKSFLAAPLLLTGLLLTSCGAAPDTTAAQQKAATLPDGSINPASANGVQDLPGNSITAPELAAEYRQNEVRADSRYKGREFCVNGIITNIKKDLADNVYVTLQTNEPISQVQCFYPNEAMAGKLNRGMEAKFKGTCTGLMGNVLLKNCLLMETVTH